MAATICRELTTAVRSTRPGAVQIAEFWAGDRAYAVRSAPGGLAFDASLCDGLRDTLRAVLAEAAGGVEAAVHLDRLRAAFGSTPGFPAAWRAVQCLENHDVVLWDYGQNRPRAPRVARLADASNPRSWYAGSRARVATTLLMTAPGIPMLFMGQEILEDKPWHDDIRFWSRFLVWWDGLERDPAMRDFHFFAGDLIGLRRWLPALRAEGCAVPQVHEQDRVMVVHRWVEGEGRDVVVVASLSESTYHGYPVDLPWPGFWREVFNSDYYDHFPNALVSGNGCGVLADGPPGLTSTRQSHDPCQWCRHPGATGIMGSSALFSRTTAHRPRSPAAAPASSSCTRLPSTGCRRSVIGRHREPKDLPYVSGAALPL